MMTKMFSSDLQWLRKLPEVPTLILFFCFSIAETITYNFTMFRACFIDFGYDKSDCERLGTGDGDDITREIEVEVQPYVIQVLTVQELIVQVIPAIMGLLMGPWSDKNGRRPVMIMSLLGMCISGASAFAFILPEISVWTFVIPTIPMVLFGGVVPFLTAAYCYVIDITTDANRGMRMGIFEGCVSAGTLIGTLLTSYIFNWGGYITIYVLLLVCYILAELYSVFVLVESLQLEKNKKMDFKIFSLTNIRDMFKVITKPRDKNIIVMLVLLMLMGIVTKFATSGASTVTYMFLTSKLNWGLQQYTIYRTLREVLTILATVIGVYLLHRTLRIRETPLILGCSVFLMSGMLIIGYASEDWHIYLGTVMGSVSGVAGAMSRTLMSKLVDGDETGKIFSLLTVIQSLSLLGGMPLYNKIYNSTITTNAGAFNFFTSALYGLTFIFAVVILVIQKRSLKQNLFRTEKEDENVSPMKQEDTKIPEITENDNKLV